MVKIVVLYGHPSDPEAFEEHYAHESFPRVVKMLHIQRYEASKVVGTLDGTEPPYYRIAEAWYDSHEDLQAAWSSPEGKAILSDIATFATGGVTMLIAEEA